ncbi:MAG: hypothetical protein SGI77_09015 [Pirellulaceae bacterium]|nr:hypothetical protein [Pirellulaceae bacterium]
MEQEILNRTNSIDGSSGAKKLLRRWWLAASAFAAIRFFVIAIGFDGLDADPDAYRAMAECWSASGTMGLLSIDGVAHATAFRPPLYPWLLSWFVIDRQLWLPAVAGLHIFLGSLTCLLSWDLAKRISEPQQKHIVIPWLVGLGVAVDPILCRQSCLIMTETTATFLAVLTIWIWVFGVGYTQRFPTWLAFLIGTMLGINCLVRPSSLAWCWMLILGLCIHRWRTNKVERSRNSVSYANILVCASGIVLLLIPWMLRNRAEFGSMIWTTTHGGYTLLLANNPVYFDHLDADGVSRTWDEDGFHERWSHRNVGDPRTRAFWESDFRSMAKEPVELDEIADDRLANQTAIATIKRSPWLFVKACLTRQGWFWAWWPSGDQVSRKVSAAIGIWYGVLFLAFVYGSWRGISAWLSRRVAAATSLKWIPAVALIVALGGVHTVYWSNMRMRAPIVPLVVWIALSPRSLRIFGEKPKIVRILKTS